MAEDIVEVRRLSPRAYALFNSTAPGMEELFNSGLRSKKPNAKARSYDLMKLN